MPDPKENYDSESIRARGERISEARIRKVSEETVVEDVERGKKATRPKIADLPHEESDFAKSYDELLEATLDAMVADPADQIGEALEAPGHPRLKGGLKVRTLPHFEGLGLPDYKSKLASGMDLIAAIHEPIHLNSIGSTAMIPTGICVEVPVGFEAQIRPRSGLAAKSGITVLNTPGTVDADYRGEIKIILTNIGGRRFTVERGMRIAQMVICPVVQTDLYLVDELSETERGDGGYGSTGV